MDDTANSTGIQAKSITVRPIRFISGFDTYSSPSGAAWQVRGATLVGVWQRSLKGSGSLDKEHGTWAGVLALLPWLLQWHNARDPQYGLGLGDFFRSFVEEETRHIGKSLNEARAWQAPAKATGRKRDRGGTGT